MAEFYEIRTAASEDELPDGSSKRTYQSAELSGITVFVWQRDASVTHLQVVMGERYLEWSAERGVSAGSLYREQDGFGIRSLRPHREIEGELAQARSLFSRHVFPDDLQLTLGALLTGDPRP